MSDLNHRAGVEEACLVVRHLKLEGGARQNRQAIMDEIDHTFGVDAVSFDERSGVLEVAYDAIHCDIDGIQAHGADLGHDWWARFKEDYYRFADENVKDNATTNSGVATGKTISKPAQRPYPILPDMGWVAEEVG